MKLKVIAHKAVPDYPGRSEARVKKRRFKAYPLMTKPGMNLKIFGTDFRPVETR
ncbi:MAG: hypothetical protein V7L20_06035 [Nostoc sp.]|uniref:hypothetical protein n=1 Tax=Nostoc sp. TaxID=1180 RepID=UPI002FFB556F